LELWSFSSPTNKITDFVWKGLGYGYEFGLFIGAEVAVPENSHPDVKFIDGQWRAHVISDGVKLGGPEISSNGLERWAWQPIIESTITGLEYRDPITQFIASSDDIDRDGDEKPDSWPLSWGNKWPGKWRYDEPLGDQEFIYGMDDRDNKEFEYYPFPEDSSRKGLGIEVETRVVQFASGLYEDVIFAVYEISNVSMRDLDKVIIGFLGDPHIGGPDDWNDDRAIFDKSSGLAMAWDDDGTSVHDPNITPGYFGLLFTQTPGNPTDGIDNDNDGMTDESPYNGIDDDGDWNSALDDLGEDGLPETADTGEGDGQPTVGEPNFELRDVDETDMIGTTSFAQPYFSGFKISDDEKMWNYLVPGNYDTTSVAGDNVFLPGCGYFSLPAQTTIHVGVAFVLGDDEADLKINVRHAQKLYNSRLGGLTSDISHILTTVDSAAVFVGEIHMTWNQNDLPADAEIEFLAKKANGSWINLGVDSTNSGSITLDVSQLESSAFYNMQNVAVSSSAFGKKDSPFFTIDNSAGENVAPEIVPLIHDEISLTGDFLLEWLSADVDGDEYEVQITLISDVASETFNPVGNSLLLSTQNFPNNTYTILYKISDQSSDRTESREVKIFNEILAVDSTLIKHQKGFASGTLIASILNETQLTGHIYKIVINDQNPSDLKYSVIDSTIGDTLIFDDQIEHSPSSGYLFDGISLSFINDQLALNEQKTGWKAGSQTNISFSVIQEHSYKKVPVDYEIRFFSQLADTGVLGNTAPFEIWNTTNMQKSKFVIIESIFNGTWDLEDAILILENGITPDDKTWLVVFTPDSTSIPPQNGDVFELITDKPFSSSDIYSLNTTTLGIEEDETAVIKDFILHQNYPNPFNGQTTIKYSINKSRFIKLEIYNSLGQLVYLEDFGRVNPGEHSFLWAGKNIQNNAVSTGIYFYRIKFGEKLSKVNKMIFLK